MGDDAARVTAVLARVERDLGATELPIAALPYRDPVLRASNPPDVPR